MTIYPMPPPDHHGIAERARKIHERLLAEIDLGLDEEAERSKTPAERDLEELQAAVIHFLTYRTSQSQDELRKLVGMDARATFE